MDLMFPRGRPTKFWVSRQGVLRNREITESPERSNAALAGPSAMATWSSGEVRNASCRRSGHERGGRFKATHHARANSTQVNEYSEACENCGGGRGRGRGLGAPGDLSWKRPGEMVQITGNIQISPSPLRELLLLRIRVITTATVRVMSVGKSRFVG